MNVRNKMALIKAHIECTGIAVTEMSHTIICGIYSWLHDCCCIFPSFSSRACKNWWIKPPSTLCECFEQRNRLQKRQLRNHYENIASTIATILTGFTYQQHERKLQYTLPFQLQQEFSAELPTKYVWWVSHFVYAVGSPPLKRQNMNATRKTTHLNGNGAGLCI